MSEWIVDLDVGDPSRVDLLGGKGANLAEMTRLGLPVPPGFTITTDAWRVYREAGELSQELVDEIEPHLKRLEEAIGRRFGDPDDPLLVSVRSGSPRSMPGMMDTLLNVGLNDEVLRGFIAATKSPAFAFDCYARLIETFARTVLRVDGVEAARPHQRAALLARVDTLKHLIESEGRSFPQDPREQLRLSIEAVFRSWENDRARQYRAHHNVPHSLGTAVTVQAMVFGNRGRRSGTGVAFTRNPATGEPSPFGDYLAEAQGEDVVAGTRDPVPLDSLAGLHPDVWRELRSHLAMLENHFRDMCDIEFTIEEGRLWLLQCRIGKRSATAEWVIAADMVDQGLVDEATVLRERITLSRLDELLRPSLREDVKRSQRPIAQGVPASPGVASGRVVFAPAAAARSGGNVILVRQNTSPDDYSGMVAAAGILTVTGGTNSHAAVVARGEGKPAVCGATTIQIDLVDGRFTAGDVTIHAGDWITIDGNDGSVYHGQLPTCGSTLEAALQGNPTARRSPLWRAYRRLACDALAH